MAMALTADDQADVSLVRAVQQGDRYALDELVHRHGRWVRSVAYGVLGDPDRVDDVCQQAWAQVWEQIRYLRDTACWKAWVYRLVRNAAVDVARESARVRHGFNEWSRQAEAGYVERVQRAPGPDGVLGEREEAEVVRQAVRGLPAIYREPFVLRHMEGWSYRQIAEAMGMPVNTVETRLVRARRLLREALDGKVSVR